MLDKNNPSPEWVAAVRHRYPVETEIDQLLTRKLARRATCKYEHPSLEGLTKGIEKICRANVDRPFTLSNVRWLSGGASKLQVAFDVISDAFGPGATKRLVLRMEPAESIVETSRQREYEVIKAVEPHLPVPSALWVDADGEYFPYPAMIYGLVTGVNKPSGRVTQISGLGVNFGPELRPRLAAQFVDHLATLHKLDHRMLDLPSFDVPATPTQAAQWQINWWRRVWEEDANEDIPLLHVAECWMRENLPATDRLAVIHGDFRNGNFLFDEETGAITAWLDWELAHIGDIHEDIAWVLARCFGHSAEDGKTFLMSGLLSEAAFLDAYQKASGFSIDAKTLKFYQVLVLYKCVVLTLSTGYRVVRGGKTHQDILVAWLMAVGYVIMGELRSTLEDL